MVQIFLQYFVIKLDLIISRNSVRHVKVLFIMDLSVNGLCQGLLQLQAWVSANGVLKDCIINLYL